MRYGSQANMRFDSDDDADDDDEDDDDDDEDDDDDDDGAQAVVDEDLHPRVDSCSREVDDEDLHSEEDRDHELDLSSRPPRAAEHAPAQQNNGL